MRDALLIIVLLGFICMGFPLMKRLDRFLNEKARPERERPEKESDGTGK